MVERVTVVSGLKAALPISLSQIWARRSGSTGAFNPAARSASETSAQRSLTSPPGVAEREPRALDVADHARRLDLGGAVHDAPDHPLGRERPAIAPPGSTLSSVVPVERARPGAGSTTRGCRSGRRRRRLPGAAARRRAGASAGRLYAFRPTNDHVGIGDRGDVGGGGRVALEVAPGAVHAHAVLDHRPQMLAAGDQRHIAPGASERGADERADGARTEHREPHAPPPSSCARHPRPLHLAGGGLRDLLDDVDPVGHLERRQRAAGVAADVLAGRVAAQDDRRGDRLAVLLVGDAERDRLGNRGLASSTASTSWGEMFSPPRMISSLSRPARRR